MKNNNRNVIPRNAARLYITFTHSGELNGVRAIVEKDIYNRWIITTEAGEQYMGLPAHLRTREYCIIEKTETAEEVENGDLLHPYQVEYIKKNLEAAKALEAPQTANADQAEETTAENNAGQQEATEAANQDIADSVFYTVENAKGEIIAAGTADNRNAATTAATKAVQSYITDTGNAARFAVGGSRTPIADSARQFMKKNTGPEEPTETPARNATAAPQSYDTEATRNHYRRKRTPQQNATQRRIHARPKERHQAHHKKSAFFKTIIQCAQFFGAVLLIAILGG